jgi:hypothetical protein
VVSLFLGHRATGPQPAPFVTGPDPDAAGSKPKRRGRRPAAVLRARAPRAAATLDWLYHHLTASGPAATLDDFAAAARGAAVTPWQLDSAAIEADIFARAVAQPVRQRNLTVDGCRILWRGNFASGWKCAKRGRPNWSGKVWPVYSTCARCGRCRARSCNRDRAIPTRWSGWRRTGASPTGSARWSCAKGRRRDGG